MIVNSFKFKIKHHLNRKPFDEFGTDLKAIDIQRGRDYGLASYNDYREQCGLMRAYHWSDFSNEISHEVSLLFFVRLAIDMLMFSIYLCPFRKLLF